MLFFDVTTAGRFATIILLVKSASCVFFLSFKRFFSLCNVLQDIVVVLNFYQTSSSFPAKLICNTTLRCLQHLSRSLWRFYNAAWRRSEDGILVRILNFTKSLELFQVRISVAPFEIYICCYEPPQLPERSWEFTGSLDRKCFGLGSSWLEIEINTAMSKVKSVRRVVVYCKSSLFDSFR